MLYYILRNGQTFGPYSRADLERYVRSGNVLLTDLAKSDTMATWLPVEQILNAPPEPLPSQPAPGSIYPDPPNLNWALVLVLSLLTCGLFMPVWNLILSSWMKRVLPSSQAFVYYIIGYALLVVSSGYSGFFFAMHHHHFFHHHTSSSLLALVGWVIRLIARFTMKANLEQHFNGPEPVGLRLSGVMTFFFGGLYFQYHLNRIMDMRNGMRLRGAL